MSKSSLGKLFPYFILLALKCNAQGQYQGLVFTYFLRNLVLCLQLCALGCTLVVIVLVSSSLITFCLFYFLSQVAAVAVVAAAGEVEVVVIEVAVADGIKMVVVVVVADGTKTVVAVVVADGIKTVVVEVADGIKMEVETDGIKMVETDGVAVVVCYF